MTGPAWNAPPADRRCSARSSQSGEQCRRWSIPGGSVCAYHGGSAPQVRAAARRRLALADATETVAAIAAEVGPIDPKHPLEALLEACDRVNVMVAVWGSVVAGLGGEHDEERRGLSIVGPDHLGDLRPHPAVDEYRRWLALQADVNKRALDAGVDERRVRVSEQQTDELLASIDRTLRSLELSDEFIHAFRQRLAADLRATSGTRTLERPRAEL